jgi:S-adenosylmethionine:tRNA ribosyltransferase-isomerase
MSTSGRTAQVVKTSEFSFDLPPGLIAQEPAADRDGARLLRLDRAAGAMEHGTVRDLPGWIRPGTLIVLNDTRVRKARLYAQAPSGAQVEFLLLEKGPDAVWQALVSRSGRAHPGKSYHFPGGLTGTIIEARGQERTVRFDGTLDEAYLERHGHVPLPPYIHRRDNPADAERYQTVYARSVGSAAAPTAGLHFTPQLLERLSAAGAEISWITLHVGLGTFSPIRAEDIEDHAMHLEHYSVPPETRKRVEAARRQGRTVLAVGTTVVRCLESAWTGEGPAEGEGSTRLFIRPGHRFQAVDQLFTNFHTPGSSLLVLVSAFAGRERVLQAYAEAVRRGYRFFSYGDAMLIQ